MQSKEWQYGRHAAPRDTARTRGRCDGLAAPDSPSYRSLRLKERDANVPCTVPPIVYQVLRSPGQPLDPATRTFFEPRFGRDFSGVRVHTDPQAADSAGALNALAYTSGHHVVFGGRQFREGTGHDRKLLAHELAHVVQQEDKNHCFQKPSAGIISKKDESSGEKVLSLEGMRIYGTDSFIKKVQADISELEKTRQGRGCLNELIADRKPWYKTSIRIRSGVCGFINDTIWYGEGGCDLSRCPDGSSGWIAVPSYVYLFHEFVHAYLYYIAGKGTHADRECMVTGLGSYFDSIPYNENRLRCELGHPVRPCYGSECAGFPPPSCRKDVMREKGPDRSPASHHLSPEQTAGNQAVQRMPKPRILQAKLRIGQPNDIYEREADRVADEVMRMPEAVVQRKPPGDKNSSVEEDKGSGVVRLKASPSAEAAVPVPDNCLDTSRAGQPLDPVTRRFMEPRFGYDLGNVRIHADAMAAESARVLDASAYTWGNEIFFGKDRYVPWDISGKRLLAHELAHTIQQGSSGIPAVQFQKSGSIQDPYPKIDRAAYYSMVREAVNKTKKPDVVGNTFAGLIGIILDEISKEENVIWRDENHHDDKRSRVTIPLPGSPRVRIPLKLILDEVDPAKEPFNGHFDSADDAISITVRRRRTPDEIQSTLTHESLHCVMYHLEKKGMRPFGPKYREAAEITGAALSQTADIAGLKKSLADLNKQLNEGRSKRKRAGIPESKVETTAKELWNEIVVRAETFYISLQYWLKDRTGTAKPDPKYFETQTLKDYLKHFGMLTDEDAEIFTASDEIFFRQIALGLAFRQRSLIKRRGVINEYLPNPLEPRDVSFSFTMPTIECGLMSLDEGCTIKPGTVMKSGGY